MVRQSVNLGMVNMTASRADPDGAKALARGLALLRLVFVDRGRTRLAELAAGLGLPRTTMYRLVAELQRQGLVIRVARGRYDIGLALADPDPAITRNGQLARVAREPLKRLVGRIGLTAHLGVFENDMVTYLVKSPSPDPAARFTREGGQLEAYCSGVGKVLLAALPDAALAAYLAAGPFIPFTHRTITELDALAACLDQVRRQGWAIDDEEAADGLRCLAVPLTLSGGAPIAAISASMAADPDPRRDAAVLSALHACADEIASALGSAPSA